MILTGAMLRARHLPATRALPALGEEDAAAPARNQIKDRVGKDQKPAKPPGKRPGTPGHWRRQPIVVNREIEHVPTVLGAHGNGPTSAHGNGPGECA